MKIIDRHNETVFDENMEYRNFSTKNDASEAERGKGERVVDADVCLLYNDGYGKYVSKGGTR